jgi:rhamnosyltransferase
MPLLEQCLKEVLRQETDWPFEVIVIDSSSTDGTWEFLATLPVKRQRIAPRDFNHGGTRNLGAQEAQGSFLVFLVQDAIPADHHWLANLVAACDQPRVAGAYSRQIPRPESTPITRYLTVGTTPNTPRPERKALPPGKQLSELSPPNQFHLALFQNASSCIRRSVWQEHPFAVVPYGEDMEWGKRAIESGLALVYEPSSAVYHSHDRSPYYALKRAYADHYQAAELFGWIMIPSLVRALRVAAGQIRHGLTYVLTSEGRLVDRLRFGVLTPLFMVSVVFGQFLGPQALLAAYKYHWLARLDKQLRKGV